MQVVQRTRELQALADAERAAGRRLALVPTMGALHEGHLSLVEAARKRADRVWLSIFVNPTQFGQGEDFERYPRDLESDLEKCRGAGVDVVFAPTVEDMYPAGRQTWVDVTDITRPLCGASRPGHFRGVTTVVSRLLLAAKPHVAVFGAKDFQQVAVLRRMVADLGFDVEIASAPTLREPDGLALSSRNANLSPAARREALSLVRALDAAEAAIEAGARSAVHVLEIVRRELGRASLAQVDYAELRDPDSLEPAPPIIAGPVLLALAVRFFADERAKATGAGAVRLIDNRVLVGHSPRVSEERP